MMHIIKDYKSLDKSFWIIQSEAAHAVIRKSGVMSTLRFISVLLPVNWIPLAFALANSADLAFEIIPSLSFMLILLFFSVAIPLKLPNTRKLAWDNTTRV
jgi:hypothetical protein